MAEASPRSEIQPGSMLGSYKVQSRIGSGSMGDVYFGIDERLRRKVALKILSPTHRNNRDFRMRFEREARAVAAISHPNVVSIFAIDEYDGRPFFAMEYLSGQDLGRMLRRRGSLPEREVVAVLIGAARGLRAAAEAGVIHRDVKPANLVVTESGLVKVTDFGLAKAVHLDAHTTAAGLVVGTPDYIAPEQACGKKLDHRADVYSLGCTLFHLLSGRPPYRAPAEGPAKSVDVVIRHLRQKTPDLRQYVPEIDVELAELCRRMMAKQAEQRPSYEEIAEAAERVAARVGARLPQCEIDPASRGSSGRVARARVGRGRQQLWAFLITLFSALVFAVGVGFYLADRSRPPRRPPPAAGSPATAPQQAAGSGSSLVR